MNTWKNRTGYVRFVGTIVFLGCISLILNGCATIPKESVKLSESLGTMISHSDRGGVVFLSFMQLKKSQLFAVKIPL